jgi:hypothetical protein
MTQIFSLAIIATLCSTLLMGCEKEHEHHKKDEIKNITLNITQAANAVYTLDLSAYGDADDINGITTQATHFTTSAITKNATTGKYTYTYQGLPTGHFSYAANDAVILKISEPTNGRCHRVEETNITINFTLQ